jgi:hypothetical protein
VFVRAKELPKGALVEYQVNLHTGRPGVSSGAELPATHAGDSSSGDEIDDDDDEDEELRPVYASGGDETLWWESCATSSNGQGSRAMVFVSGESGGTGWDTDRGVTKTLMQLRYLRGNICSISDSVGAHADSGSRRVREGVPPSIRFPLDA